jgi:ectoine hydroxylase-related dioxygenase (phytanoyl-CoA dioxygenase family)
MFVAADTPTPFLIVHSFSMGERGADFMDQLEDRMSAPVDASQPQTPSHHYDSAGYFIEECVFGEDEIDRLRQAIADIPNRSEVRKRQGVYGVRNLLEISPDVRQLACDPRLRRIVEPILGPDAIAVRAVFFDKVEGANWSLFWHQDNVIAVKEKVETPGFTGWAQKAGVWQVQPPADILGRMIALRIHLDDCAAANGPLRVLPGSHRHGWIEDLNAWKNAVAEVVCVVGSGGVVGMCPLTLHASAPAEVPGHRRVIHIEYANEDLPGGLDWNNRVQ